MNQDYFNVGWGGVRSSALPYALEAHPDTGDLSYSDPAAVDYLPLCSWGRDDPVVDADTAGRAVRKNLADPAMSGYTVFVQDGLVLDDPDPIPVPDLPCAMPDGTMGASCTPAEIEAGAVRLELFVRPGLTPDCKRHGVQAHGPFALQCEMHDTGFNRADANLHQADPCRPWSKLGLVNTRTDEVLQVEFLKHWSWRSNSRRMYFSVASASTAAAIEMVNAMFNNEDNSEQLSIQLVVMSQLPAATVPPANYDPGGLSSFTFVYGKAAELQSGAVEGQARRRIGSTRQGAGTRDYTIFTIIW